MKLKNCFQEWKLFDVYRNVPTGLSAICRVKFYFHLFYRYLKIEADTRVVFLCCKFWSTCNSVKRLLDVYFTNANYLCVTSAEELHVQSVLTRELCNTNVSYVISCRWETSKHGTMPLVVARKCAVTIGIAGRTVTERIKQFYYG